MTTVPTVEDRLINIGHALSLVTSIGSRAQTPDDDVLDALVELAWRAKDDVRALEAALSDGSVAAPHDVAAAPLD